MKLLDDGLEDEFEMLTGVNDSILKSVNLKYDGGDSPAFSVDRLTNTDSEELYRSDDGYGRIFLNDPGDSFKTIASTITFGALRDADSLSKKPYLMAEMVDYFLGITTVTDIREAFGAPAQQATAYPNPANTYTRIEFRVSENTSAGVKIYDQSGRLVNRFEMPGLQTGTHTLTWNLTDAGGNRVPTGLYMVSISDGSKKISTAKVLVR